MMGILANKYVQRVLFDLDTLRRDLLTERRAAHRIRRYIPAWEADARPPIVMRQAVEEPTRTSAVRRAEEEPTGTPAVQEDDEMASNYYIIIHCAKCGVPMQARKQGSKGKLIRICAACAAALKRRSRAA